MLLVDLLRERGDNGNASFDAVRSRGYAEVRHLRVLIALRPVGFDSVLTMGRRLSQPR
jgi:hypothetical protein